MSHNTLTNTPFSCFSQFPFLCPPFSAMSRRVTWLVLIVALLALFSASCVSGRPSTSTSTSALEPVSRAGLRAANGAATRMHQRVQHTKKAGTRRVGSKLGSYYHSTRQIYDNLKEIASNCKYATIDWLHAPTGEKSLMTVRINYEPETYPKKSERALFFFGEHARELISPEVGLEFVRRACDPTLLETRFLNVDAKMIDILKTTEFLIFPNANPYGRRITERGAYCNRVNDRKVDLNRNWGEHWSSKSDHPDTYPGTQAWSESETVILARAASTFSPTIFISIHSGSLHMLSPFAFKGSLAGEPASSTTAVDPPNMKVQKVEQDSLVGTGLKPVLTLLKHVNQDFCRCRVGAAGKELGYLSPGTCLDYIYNRVGTRYAFALEIYSGKRYAGPPRKSRPSALLEEEMTQRSLVDLETENDMDSEFQLTHEDENLMMELKSHETSSMPLAAFPSFELPSFTEVASSTSSPRTNDGDIPEQSVILFPRTQRGKARACLIGFNPVTAPMYKRTVDHWSRGLLAFVQAIQATRPKEGQQQQQAETTNETEEEN